MWVLLFKNRVLLCVLQILSKSAIFFCIQKSYFALNKFVLIFFWGGGGGCGNNDLKLKKKKSLPKTQDKKVQYYEIQYFENY